MPTKREREYYAMGYRDGIKHTGASMFEQSMLTEIGQLQRDPVRGGFDFNLLEGSPKRRRRPQKPKKKRTLTAWQKFVRTNSKKKEFRLRGGKVNLKKLGVAYRKKTGKRKGKK